MLLYSKARTWFSLMSLATRPSKFFSKIYGTGTQGTGIELFYINYCAVSLCWLVCVLLFVEALKWRKDFGVLEIKESDLKDTVMERVSWK